MRFCSCLGDLHYWCLSYRGLCHTSLHVDVETRLINKDAIAQIINISLQNFSNPLESSLYLRFTIALFGLEVSSFQWYIAFSSNKLVERGSWYFRICKTTSKILHHLIQNNAWLLIYEIYKILFLFRIYRQWSPNRSTASWFS